MIICNVCGGQTDLSRSVGIELHTVIDLIRSYGISFEILDIRDKVAGPWHLEYGLKEANQHPYHVRVMSVWKQDTFYYTTPSMYPHAKISTYTRFSHLLRWLDFDLRVTYSKLAL